MTRRFLLFAVATLAILATSAATTEAATPQEVAAALKASPCAGQPITVLWDADLEAQGFGALATGSHYTDSSESVIVFDRCEVTRNPIDWAKLTLAERCEQDVHEAGHLAGLADGDGVMAHKPEERYWAGCHTLRDRIRHDMARLVPDRDPWVVCRRWEGRVLPCRVEWSDRQFRAHVTWFRARVRGQAYAIQRVKVTR